jgi:tetratricopeptide (TPR) repeat protein
MGVDLRLIETLLPHVQLLISYNYTTEICKLLLAKMLYELAFYNFLVDQWTLAVQYLEECLKLRETIRGPEHKETIETMIELAYGSIMASSPENHDRAEKLLRQAVVLSEKYFPDLYTFSLRRLARLLSERGKLTESEELFQQVIKIVREKDGMDSLSAMSAMSESTYLYQAQDRHEEAENVQRKVVEIFKARGDRDRELAMHMERLARILSSRHKYREELELWREILSIWTESLGPTHPITLKTRNSLARCLGNCDEHEEVEEIIRELLEIWTQTLGANHEDTLKSMRDLAFGLTIMGRYDEAEGIQQDALVRCTKALGPEHELTLLFMYDLGNTLFYVDKEDEAKDLLCQALQLHVKVFGPEYKRTLSIKKLLEEGLEESSRGSGSAPSDLGWVPGGEPEEAAGNTREEGAMEAGPPKDSGKQDRSEDAPLDLSNLEITEEDSGK